MTPSMILSHMRELKRIASSLYVGRQGGSVVCEVLFGSEALDCIGKAILWNGVEKPTRSSLTAWRSMWVGVCVS